MKSYNKLVTLVVVLVVVIFATSIYSCCSFKPYSMNNIFSNKFSKYENMANKEEEKKEEEIEGFQVMSDETSYANVNDNTPIDSFSKLEGSLSSEGCAGLTNSQGPLVCNDEQKKLLSTRGGNATGVADQIGSA
tara:strand:- start:1663 stop:2064 length:402 start_codon:yes stop_codon:yes gene_type:complete